MKRFHGSRTELLTSLGTWALVVRHQNIVQTRLVVPKRSRAVIIRTELGNKQDMYATAANRLLSYNNQEKNGLSEI